MDGTLIGRRVHPGWPENQVKFPHQRVRNGLQTTGAGSLEIALEMTLQTNIGDHFLRSAMLVDDLRTACGGQRSGLRRLIAQIYRPRRKALVELKRFLLKLQNFNHHALRVRRTALAVNWLARCRRLTNGSLKMMNNNSSIQLRKATTADLTQLVVMVNEAYRMEEAFLEGRRIDLDRMKGHFESGVIYVAETRPSGHLVASVYAEALSDKATTPCAQRDTPQTGGAGYIGLLAVDPAWQGKGLARLMMAAAEDNLRHLGCIAAELSVLSMLPDLPPLYEHLGYSRTGTTAFCFHRKLKPGVECQVVLMAKKL